MTRLVLHLGPPKTGTTSLQRALYENRDALLRQGIFVPVFPVSLKTESHHVLQSLCKPDTGIERYWQQGRQDLDLVNYGAHLYDHMLAEMRGNGAPVVVLSSELYWAGAYFPEFCRLLRRDFDAIQPMIYVRDPTNLFRSELQQAAKAGRFANVVPTLSPKVARTQHALGAPLMFRPYLEPSLDPHWNVVDDFWNNVLRCAAPPDSDLPRANTADSVELTLVLLQVARFYRRDNPNCDMQHEIFERITYLRNAALALGSAGGPLGRTKRLVLSDEIEARIAAASHPDREWLDRYMQDPSTVHGAVPQDRQATRIFADVDELFRHTEKETDACMALIDGLMVWIDTVIAGGDCRRLTLNLRTALNAACHHLKALLT